MSFRICVVLLVMVAVSSCTRVESSPVGYLDYSGRNDLLVGGIRMIPIQTPKGTFKVWTKRVGNNPKIKVLLLHGGPASSHEYLEVFDSYFPSASIEYYYYDQLGSYYSDQPKDESKALWEIPRFVEEVEQVRKALNLDAGNFYLYGHSWGGLLAVEYALKYQQHLKGLVISNMMMSGKAYNEYAERVKMPAMDQKALAEIKRYEAEGKTQDPEYMRLVTDNYYVTSFLRMPPDQWPETVSRTMKHMNWDLYVPMQGTSELTVSGSLREWDRTADLGKIRVPTLFIGAKHDTMDPKHMEWASRTVQKGRFLLCANGSHLALYDDQATYFTGLIQFIKDVDAGRF